MSLQVEITEEKKNLLIGRTEITFRIEHFGEGTPNRLDVKKKIGYWVFMQKYVSEKLTGENWRDKNKKTIRIPVSNLLSDTTSLKKAVIDADRYMMALHPASPVESIRTQRMRVENIDSRFKIDVSATEKGINYKLYAKEPVSCFMKISGQQKDLAPKIDDLIGRGLPVRFEPGEIDISGTPLFDDIIKQGTVLKFANAFNGTVSLIILDSGNNEKNIISEIPCEFSGGTREIRTSIELLDSPLNVSISITFNSDIKSATIKTNFQFNSKKWCGQSLKQLNYFDQISNMIYSILDGGRLKIKFYMRGQYSDFIFNADNMDFIQQIASGLDVIKKARIIADMFSINPVFPKNLGDKEVQEVILLNDVLEKLDKPACDGNGVKLGMHVEKKVARKILKENKGVQEQVVFTGGPNYYFFGSSVPIGYIEIVLTKARMHPSLDEMKKQLNKSKENIFQIEWIGTEDSELIVRKKKTDADTKGTDVQQKG